MSAEYDVSIILVNYNGKKYIDTLFDGLMHLRHSDFSYEIVFVDNASSDGSVTYLKENYGDQLDNLQIVSSRENLGFAGGNNLGVRHSRGEYIVLLNNDTRPEENWLETLYHYIRERRDVVIANSKLVFFYDFIRIRFFTRDKILLKRNIRINGKTYQVDNKFCKNTLCEPEQLVCFGHTEICLPLLDGERDHQFEFDPIQCAEDDVLIYGEEHIPIVKGQPTVLKLTKEQAEKGRITLIQNAGSGITEKRDGFDIGFCQEDGEAFQKEYEINNGCGASIIFRKEDFIRCGGFDERFFMYYEDTDLSYRMKKDGRKIMYCPDSVVRHIHAGSSGEWSPFFTYHVTKNKLLFVAKNFGKKEFLKYYCRQMGSGIKQKNKSKIKGTQKAMMILLFGAFNRGKASEHLLEK